MKNQNKLQHTQGEWRKDIQNGDGIVKILSPYEEGKESQLIAVLPFETANQKANAQRIVKAVNMHDDMVEVLKIALANLKSGANSTKDMIEQLLKQVE